MTRTSDEIAAWFYYLEDSKLYSVGLESSVAIHCIYKILNLLYIDKLLLPRKIYFGKIKDGLEILDAAPEKVVIQILKQLDIAKALNTIYIEGETELLLNGERTLEGGILDLTFEFGSVDSRFYLNTYSDCWVPIDRDDNIQEELAIDSSRRLEKCLSSIESEVAIKEKSPESNEESEDMYILPQKGNRVYTKSNLSNLIKNSEALKYFWNQRNSYPA